MALLRPVAEKGDTAAMVPLAQILLEGGPGVAADPVAARGLAEKATAAGYGRANLQLGEIWLNGMGVAADPAKALTYFHAADDLGDMKAGRYIGLIAASRGNPAEAAQWYRKSADAGDITSQFYLGRAYETGAGVPQDYDEAMVWYRKSASRGDIIASDGMVGMAGLYERGLGVPPDPARAGALYRQAAAVGNADAKAALKRLGLS